MVTSSSGDMNSMMRAYAGCIRSNVVDRRSRAGCSSCRFARVAKEKPENQGGENERHNYDCSSHKNRLLALDWSRTGMGGLRSAHRHLRLRLREQRILQLRI